MKALTYIRKLQSNATLICFPTKLKVRGAGIYNNAPYHKIPYSNFFGYNLQTNPPLYFQCIIVYVWFRFFQKFFFRFLSNWLSQQKCSTSNQNYINISAIYFVDTYTSILYMKLMEVVFRAFVCILSRSLFLILHVIYVLDLLGILVSTLIKVYITLCERGIRNLKTFFLKRKINEISCKCIIHVYMYVYIGT